MTVVIVRLSWLVDEEVIARQIAEKEQLENDVELLNQIIEMSSKLSSPHDVSTYIILHVIVTRVATSDHSP